MEKPVSPINHLSDLQSFVEKLKRDGFYGTITLHEHCDLQRVVVEQSYIASEGKNSNAYRNR